MNRPEAKTLYLIGAGLLLWGLIGWMLISLRNSQSVESIQWSTSMLRILCASASVLLLLTSIAAALALSRIARESESEQKFPPASAPQLASLGNADGESAWMWAARLRGWSAGILALGVLIAAAGLSIVLRAHPMAVMPPAF